MKRLISFILLLTMFATVCSGSLTVVFADSSNLNDYVGEIQFSKEFEEWMNLPEEERNTVKEPRSYEVLDTKFLSKNPIDIAS